MTPKMHHDLKEMHNDIKGAIVLFITWLFLSQSHAFLLRMRNRSVVECQALDLRSPRLNRTIKCRAYMILRMGINYYYFSSEIVLQINAVAKLLRHIHCT